METQLRAATTRTKPPGRTGGLLASTVLCLAGFAPNVGWAQGATGSNSLASPPSTEGNGHHAVRRVETAQVTPAPAAAPVTFSGVVRAEKRAHLAFTLGGRMVLRPAQVGQAVKANAELARLDLAPLRNARAAAKAQLDDVEARLKQLSRDVERERRLVDKGAGRRETLEKLNSGLAGTRAARARAQAGYAEAHRQLNEARLRAPFAGTIIQVMLEPGEFARPGVPVVVLSAEDRLEVEVQVPEAVRSRLKREAPVKIALPLAGGHTLEGHVSRLGRGASGPGQLFPVVVRFPGSDRVAPGYTAEVVFEVDTPDAVMVPVAAIADPGGRSPFVFRIRNGRAEKVPVQVVRLVGDQVAVRSKLAVGDPIVIKGHISLLAGERVETAQ